ncbi:PREDICTED: uncharacterized protein LOC106628144 [Pseudopodoces humilis]|uniref:uncharacterized protein LOC106628144 n=1 Tax=Pseudopodoces humilis TaxID=181119 RepID=UPI0006B83232|nr:PREDICTED: uncharacterized protein LOC106628144 [Pseudopodoces humilis]
MRTAGGRAWRARAAWAGALAGGARSRRRADSGRSRRAPPSSFLGSFHSRWREACARHVSAAAAQSRARAPPVRALPPHPRLRRGGRARDGNGTGGRALSSRSPAPLRPGARAGGPRWRGQWVAAGGHLTGGVVKGTERHPGSPAGKSRVRPGLGQPPLLPKPSRSRGPAPGRGVVGATYEPGLG